ncbi:ABC transporter substrate-binding protein [Lichenicola cladoniae]|uniref:ABC transporter substrate-binding protein n=1 Tax=Lichenicola cladoniae TaxID=1484109 RepID=A0A6M8HR87_9PROT|nr:ABC transporter substrate-binding protein [Lichenicola cladoniae]NPD68770.1 ABC transporter substrate-binding protein [Acetobacteraceae bacterium]QKE90806.1 ABC transporter substrate-binding protein [Lichenicola cladoniae]
MAVRQRSVQHPPARVSPKGLAMAAPTPLKVSRRAIIGGGIGTAVVAGLVVRNQFRHPHRDKTSRPDGRYRRMTLACPHPAHDPVLIVAQRQGIFARYNLDIRILDGLASGQEALDQLHLGGADAVIAPVLSWLPRLMDGLDARLVGGLQSGSARLLIARKSPIKRIEDLYRKSIGIPDASSGPHASADRLFFSVMMRRKGMDPNRDVNWVQVPPADFGDALAGRRVQAVVGHDPVIWQVRESLHLTELASSTTGSYGTRIVRALGLRADVLKADPAAAVALVLAIQEAARTVALHLDVAANVLADQLPDMDLAAVERMLHAEGHGVHLIGRELREQVAQYVDELKLIGLIPDEQDSAKLARRFCDTVVHA